VFSFSSLYLFVRATSDYSLMCGNPLVVFSQQVVSNLSEFRQGVLVRVEQLALETFYSFVWS